MYNYQHSTTRPIYVQGDALNSDLLADLNKSGWSPCYDVYASKKSKNPNLILLNIATANYWVHAMYVIKERKLHLKEAHPKQDKPRDYAQVLQYGKQLRDLPRYTDEFVREYYDLKPVLEAERERRSPAQSALSISRSVRDDLVFYRKLIDEEIAVIKQKSLRVCYKRYELYGDDQLWLHLDTESKNCSRKSDVLRHIDSATPPNAVEYTYTIQTENGRKSKQRPKKWTGVAYDLVRNDKGYILKIKDCEGLDPDDIPSSGRVCEDVELQLEEKRRQKEALDCVRDNRVASRELIQALFAPEVLPDVEAATDTLDQVYQCDAKGTPFEYSAAQNRAIQHALLRSPLSVVQGPPGTGKTTVITEIVLQLLAREPNAKILITSQTNSAVDHVLTNLRKVDIPVLRLSSSARLVPELREHTLERKLVGWRKEVVSNLTKRREELWSRMRDTLGEERKVVRDIFEMLYKARMGADSPAQQLADKHNRHRRSLSQHLRKLIERYSSLKSLLPYLNHEDMEAAFYQALDGISTAGWAQFAERNRLLDDWQANLSSMRTQGKVRDKIVSGIRVFGATTNHVAAKKYRNLIDAYDYVIMDESGKATVAESLVPIVRAKKLVLVGDHRQLRPMLTGEREVEAWLRKEHSKDPDGFDSWEDYSNRPSLFEQVMERIDEGYSSQLETCRRMPAEAVRLTSRHFYEPHGERIVPAQPERTIDAHGLSLARPGSVFFYHTGTDKSDKSGTSSRNKHTAKAVRQLIQRLDRCPEIQGKSIGVITGYTAQLRLLRQEQRQHLRRLQHIDHKTLDISVVDRFQGLEKDIIILDLVRSEQLTLGFLANANRINVALSRHKGLLIIVGNYTWTVDANAPGREQTDLPIPLQTYLRDLPNERIVTSLDQLLPG